MKKLLFALIASAAVLLSSCAEADVTVLRGESGAAGNRFPEKGSATALTVNISSGTFHLDGKCRYAEKMKEENKKIIYYSEVADALADGYEPCSACAHEYKNTEENHD